MATIFKQKKYVEIAIVHLYNHPQITMCSSLKQKLFPLTPIMYYKRSLQVSKSKFK